ncbi:MAG: DMT family transporter [Bacteroidota bacterium]
MSRGVKYMLAATFTFALMNVLVKYVPHIPATEIILFRSVISFSFSLVVLRYQKVSIWGNNQKILILRGVAGAIALILFFMLLQRIPLATVSTLSYLAPIFTTILGIFLVKEKVKPIMWVFFATSFLGILLIQGVDARISLSDLLIGILSTFFMGLAYNFIRVLKNTEHPLVIIFYFPLVTIPIVGIMSIFNWVMPVGIDWLVLIGIGSLTQVAQFYMTKAYQAEAVAKVSIVNYTSIVYSLSFGFILFDESFGLLTYLGMALVLSGVILSVIFKNRN